MRREVLITGLGVVSPFGVGVASYWNGMCFAESRPTPHSELASFVMRYKATHSVAEWTIDQSNRAPTAQAFAIRAAEMALCDADLDPRQSEAVVGAAIGNAMGDHPMERAVVDSSADNGADALPFRVAGAVAAAFELGGPVLSVSTACSAGLYSVGIGADLIRRGTVDVMLVGGAEAVSRVAMACFNRLGAIDPEGCRPFDENRRGTVMGEGAAVLVLESAEHFRHRRRAQAYGRIAGWGWSCDGHHLTIPEPTGIGPATAAIRALADSALAPDAIDCILAHGTGTRQNDETETKAMIAALGSHASTIPVCGLKGKLGHSGGAAGAFQCATAALVLATGVLPPTGGYATADPRCALKLSSMPVDATNFQNILMNSYAFGGNNISMIVDRCSHPAPEIRQVLGRDHAMPAAGRSTTSK